ncbi:hypothetical protein [Streptomyces sp. NPDC048560]|uniref:hypothetical protein n=1 Tax=Streptomyces sp. NPDC048560 TaxID=3155488 RepID=UPI003415F068
MTGQEQDGGIAAIGPDPAKTAMELILQDLLELLERQKREAQRRPALPEEPAPAQRNEAGGPGTQDTPAVTDTEKLIAYIIQEVLKRMSPPGQQPGLQQAPVQAPERFDQLYAEEHQGKVSAIAQAVETVLAENPELRKLYESGRLPRTQRFVEHARAHAGNTTSEQHLASDAATLKSPTTSGGSEKLEGEVEDDLDYLVVEVPLKRSKRSAAAGLVSPDLPASPAQTDSDASRQQVPPKPAMPNGPAPVPGR